MNYETAAEAVRTEAEVVLGTFKTPGLIDRVELGIGDDYIARFHPTEMSAERPWTWVKIGDLDLLAKSPPEPPADPEAFAGMSIRELVEIVRTESTLDPGGPEDGRGWAAKREIIHRLDAIQIYQGTEAVIIRMILSGRRSVDE